MGDDEAALDLLEGEDSEEEEVEDRISGVNTKYPEFLNPGSLVPAFPPSARGRGPTMHSFSWSKTPLSKTRVNSGIAGIVCDLSCGSKVWGWGRGESC